MTYKFLRGFVILLVISPTGDLSLSARGPSSRPTMDFTCQALAEPEINSRLSFDPEATSRAWAGMHALGVTLSNEGKPRLLMRIRPTSLGAKIKYGKAYFSHSKLLFLDGWLPALRLSFARALNKPMAETTKFLSRYYIRYYFNHWLASYFKPTAADESRRYRGRLAFDSRLFQYPAIIAFLAVPHELVHMLLINERHFLQEVTAIYRDVKRLIALQRNPSPSDAELIRDVRSHLHLPKPSKLKNSPNGGHQKPQLKVEPVEQLLEELRRLERQPLRPLKRGVAPVSSIDLWKSEHSLYSFLVDILYAPEPPTDLDILKHAVYFLFNNPDTFPSKAKAQRLFQRDDPDRWNRFLKKVIELDRKVDRLISEAPDKLPRFHRKSNADNQIFPLPVRLKPLAASA